MNEATRAQGSSMRAGLWNKAHLICLFVFIVLVSQASRVLTFDRKAVLGSAFGTTPQTYANHFSSARGHRRCCQGFIVKHYAGQVEYNTKGWLDKSLCRKRV